MSATVAMCRSQWPRGLRPLAWWDCGFESHRCMDVCLLWVFCVVSATDWSLVQRSPTDCGASCVIKKPQLWKYNHNGLQRQENKQTSNVQYWQIINAFPVTFSAVTHLSSIYLPYPQCWRSLQFSYFESFTFFMLDFPTHSFQQLTGVR
jgi:hypothetical protein